MLSSAELDEIREFVEANALPSTCTIQTPTETNEKGSVTRAFANTYTNVPCRIMPARNEGREYVSGEKITRRATYVLTVPFDQELAATYQVVCGGDTYEILGVWDDHDFRTARRADLVKVA